LRKLQITHSTEYRFASEVTLLPHRLMLRPRESQNTRIVSSQLDISPAHQLRWQRDTLDNNVAVATFNAPTASLRVASDVVIEQYDEAPFDFLLEGYAAEHPFDYQPEEAALLAPLRSLAWEDARPPIDGWLHSLSLGSAKRETFALLYELNLAINRGFHYEGREEQGVQSPATTLARESGSCRDLAALFLDACRRLGFAGRFVSGYHTSYANEVGPGSTHAWAEVYLPGPGWKGFDPTGGVVTGSDHIAVAVARHPELVPPIAGSYLGPAEPHPALFVSVHVVAL
jgi:transglutaminase-like putative cysteine protease